MIGLINDKRQAPRLPLKATLRYEIRGKSEFNTALSDNISQGGIGFTSDIFLAAKEILMLEFMLLSNAMRPIGRIGWVAIIPASGRYKIGVEFLEWDSKEERYLADYLKNQVETMA